ncbi:Pr6Pr family membrane protein [Rothia nasimurium]
MIVAAVAWPTLLLQYWLTIWTGPLGEVTVRYFSFFTILSNVLVGLVSAASVIGGNWAPLRVLRTPGARGLAAVSIMVTCLVYAAMLQGLWHPLGAQLLADRSLHYVVPFLYLAWWMALLPHGTLSWGHAARWLLFPFVFAVWTFARGALVHEYPYPFLDVDQLGYPQVLFDCLMVGALFVVLGLVLIATDRALARRVALT